MYTMFSQKYLSVLEQILIPLIISMEKMVNPYQGSTNDQTSNPVLYTTSYTERFNGKEGYVTERRPLLPKGNVFSVDKIPSVKCGAAYAIVTEGYRYFKLNSSMGINSLCYQEFLGSWTYNCTVAIVCNETIRFPPRDENGACSEGRLVLSDGINDLMDECGDIDFDMTPLYASNGGHDLYLSYNGISSATCLAFCKDDLTDGHIGVNPSKQLKKAKDYQGFRTESSCECGRRKEPGRYNRVVNGDNALKYEFPWISAVVPNDGSQNRQPFCGASLISDQYLLSAAHCFVVKVNKTHFGTKSPKDIQVLLHSHIMNKPKNPTKDWKNEMIPGWSLPPVTDEDEETIRANIKSIIIHPMFHPKSLDFDLAILKLTERINFKDKKVAPICLPKMNQKLTFEDNEFHTVAGWGQITPDGKYGARILQKIDYPFINTTVCNRYALPTKRHICGAYFNTGAGKSPCEGDSGGPMIFKMQSENNQYYVLSGVMSGKDGRCGRKDFMNLFTNVQELLPWIYRHTSNSVWCSA